MPGELINVRRPDGSVVSATPEEAARLELLGYRPETPEERSGRVIAAEEERFYTEPLQQIGAGAEGLLSGLTIGGSDLLLDSDEARARAEHNPGIRLAGEIVGAVAPAVLSGGESLLARGAAATPAGLVARAGAAAGEAVGGGAVRRAAVQAGLEGAAFGAGGEVTRAKLSGDPITAESVLAGAGWGAVWGLGIGAGLGAAERGAERLGRKLAAEEAGARLPAAARGAVADAIPQENWTALRSAVDEFSLRGQRVAAEADDAVRAAATERAPAVAATPEQEMLAARARMDEAFGANQLAGGGNIDRATRMDVLRAYKAASKAVEDGDPVKAALAVDAYKDAVARVAPEAAVAPAAQQVAKGGEAALKAAMETRAIAKELAGFPADPEAWLRMTPRHAERVFAAMDRALAGDVAELASLGEAIGAAATRMTEALGVTAEGNPVAALREAWKVARVARSQVVADQTARLVRGSREESHKLGPFGRIVRQASARASSSAARHAGAGAFLSSAAYQGAGLVTGALLGGGGIGHLGLLAEVTGIRAAVQQRLRGAVAEFGPGASREARKAAGRVEPLARRLDGTEDAEGGTPEEMFRRRSAEIRGAAPAVRDTLFRGVEPLIAAGHGEFAAALHKSAVAQYEALLAQLPRDPGTAFSARGTLWRPTDVELERFRRYYGAFQDVVGTAERVLKTGEVLPEEARALRELAPALYNDVRLELIGKLANPEFAASLDYHEQANLSLLLDLPIHSTFRPEWIAAQQGMYAQRAQLQKPTTGSGGAPGRPPGPAGNPMATKAQILTER